MDERASSPLCGSLGRSMLLRGEGSCVCGCEVGGQALVLLSPPLPDDIRVRLFSLPSDVPGLFGCVCCWFLDRLSRVELRRRQMGCFLIWIFSSASSSSSVTEVCLFYMPLAGVGAFDSPPSLSGFVCISGGSITGGFCFCSSASDPAVGWC